MEPHSTVHVFSCSSYPTPLTELDLWERMRLALELLSVLPFFDLFLLIPLSPLPLADKKVRSNHHDHNMILIIINIQHLHNQITYHYRKDPETLSARRNLFLNLQSPQRRMHVEWNLPSKLSVSCRTITVLTSRNLWLCSTQLHGRYAFRIDPDTFSMRKLHENASVPSV